MKQHHAQLLVHLPRWTRRCRPGARAGNRPHARAVQSALVGINEALAIDLPDEELNIVPVMETVLTQKEVEWFSEHGRKVTPKGKTLAEPRRYSGVAARWRRRVAAQAPARPDSSIRRVVGKPKYARYRAALVN